MGWALAIILAVAAFAFFVVVFKVPRRTWEALAAALVFGLAGFALQARPDLPEANKEAKIEVPKDAAAMVEARRELFDDKKVAGNRFLVLADGYTRSGDFRSAASFALSAAEQQPDSAEAWMALGTNLLGHAGGVLTPAAEYAYRRAIAADPAHPAAAYFLGMALAQADRLPEARAVWGALLERTPADAPWRAGLVQSLGRLDEFLARPQSAGGER